MILCLTHAVTMELARCELSYLDREPIDCERANLQHAAYCQLLAESGATVRTVAVSPDHPDGVFIEDAAIVLDELAVSTSPGAISRREEAANLLPVLAEYRDVRVVSPPATVDGGDVLRIGRRLFVGLSRRSNRQGLSALEDIVRPYGYEVVPVAVRGCLHLKSACTSLGDGRLLANGEQVDVETFAGLEIVSIAPDEPRAANALRIGDHVVLSAAYPRTAERVAALGLDVRTIDVSEFEKAEAAVTCLSLVFDRKEEGSP